MLIIAMMTMLIDHIGLIFFPDELGWRIIGRIAFPLYAYGIVLGYKYTVNINKYMMRLLILAIISQIPFMLAFHVIKLNVIFTLLISLFVISLLDQLNNMWIGIPVLIISIFAMEYIPMDYGAYGFLLIMIYRYVPTHLRIIMHFVLNLLFFLLKSWDIQMFSLISTMLIVYIPYFVESGRKSMPIWLWRGFYPGHLLLLAFIYFILSNNSNF